jgi:hypothetical protein
MKYFTPAIHLSKPGQGISPDITIPGVSVDVARPHTDWVAQIDQNDGLGFTAQTLKREFVDLFEDGAVVAAAGIFAGGPIDLNRTHFLAGRRSWRIDDGRSFDVGGDTLVLETTAVERFSNRVYQISDFALGLESRIPDIWISLLNNFVTMRGLVRVPQPLKPGWKRKKEVDYYLVSFDDIAVLRGDAEFKQQDSHGLFKSILP